MSTQNDVAGPAFCLPAPIVMVRRVTSAFALLIGFLVVNGFKRWEEESVCSG